MTTYPKPGPIADVVGTSGFAEATWANAVRDRLVNEFASTADRDSFFTAPWDGACAYVTATDTLYIHNGLAWVAFDCKPQAWTPVLSQGVAVTKTTTRATYVRNGGRCRGEIRLDVTGSGTAANVIGVSTPFTAAASGVYGTGNGVIYDSSSAVVYPFIVSLASTTLFEFTGTASNLNVVLFLGSATSDFAAGLAASDVVSFSFDFDLA